MSFYFDGSISESRPETPREKEINDKIDLWHFNLEGQGQELHEFLGWTWEEYVEWVETGVIPDE